MKTCICISIYTVKALLIPQGLLLSFTFHSGDAVKKTTCDVKTTQYCVIWLCLPSVGIEMVLRGT